MKFNQTLAKLLAAGLLLTPAAQAMTQQELNILKRSSPNQATLVYPTLLPQDYTETSFSMDLKPENAWQPLGYRLSYGRALTIPSNTPNSGLKDVGGVPYQYQAMEREAGTLRLAVDFQPGGLQVYTNCREPNSEVWQIYSSGLNQTLKFCASLKDQSIFYIQNGKPHTLHYQAYTVYQQNAGTYGVSGTGVMRAHFETFVQHLAMVHK